MLADILTAERDRLGLTNAELARRSGLAPTTTHSVLSGGRPEPSVQAVRAICRGLGRSLGWLDAAWRRAEKKSGENLPDCVDR